MSSSKENKSPDSQAEQQTDFHGAALIDEQGNETPITEAMIQNACEKIESNPGEGEQKSNSKQS